MANRMEEVIELESSDEEQGPPPGKKKRPNQPIATNIMVNIPQGVTIKPIGRRKDKQVQKITNVTNINKIKTQGRSSELKLIPIINKQLPETTNFTTINKINTQGRIPQSKVIPVNKQVQVLTNAMNINKTKIQGRSPEFKPIPIIINKQVPEITNVTTINKIKTQGRSPQYKVTPVKHVVKKSAVLSKNSTESQALQKLPPCVTVTKSGPSVAPIRTPKKCIKKVNHNKILYLPKVVDLERKVVEEAIPAKKPRWYTRPEESEPSPEKINNTNAFIEIVIEDSPVKPKTKQVRKVSSENVITIDDSPNKPQPINPSNDEGSDEEPMTSKKVPNCKKMLKYQNENLSTIVEEKTYEIEIDPIDVNEHNSIPGGPNPLSVTFNNTKDQELEIALDEVSVVLNEPIPSKKEKELCSKDSEDKEFHPVYSQFIDLCLKLENSGDMIKIVNKKIKTYYRQVPKEYTHSEEFIEMVSSKISSIEANPKEMYLYIKDIVDDLNIQRKLVKQMPIQEAKTKVEESFTQANDDMEPNKKKEIRKLEKSFKKFNTAIKKLEMQEVDFDDEDGSVYLLTEKYKEKIVRIHAKLCQLTNTKMPSEPRLVLEAGPGRAPGPAKRLEKWINKKKGLTFPDFHDVLRCVRAANTEDNLGWSEAVVMEEARDLFCRCGKKLQRRRQEREWRLATSRLTVDTDPAEDNEELKKRLEENRRVARTNESEVLNKFSDIQNLQNLEAEEIDDNDAEESPNESDDEDNDENSTLENKQKRKDILKKLLKEQAKKTSKEVSNTKETSEEVLEDTETNKPPNLDDDRNSGIDEIGSDVDELHLLQKLRSDNVIHGISSSDSSDLESPIAISDTLESSSDESIISIELSSDSDAPQNSKTDTKNNDVLNENVGEETISLTLKNNNEMIQSHDSVVDLDSDAEKSEETNNLTSKNYKAAEEKTMTETANDVLVLSLDTVVVLDSDVKPEETKKLSIESKEDMITKKCISKTSNEALVSSPDTVVASDSNAEKFEESKKLSRESRDIANRARSESPNDALVLSPDTVVDLDLEAAKPEETQKLSIKIKDNMITQKCMSKTSDEALVLLPDTIVTMDSKAAKFEESDKLSRESKNIADRRRSENSNDALVLSPDTVIGLDLEAAKPEETNKLSRESNDNTAERITCKTSNDVSPHIVVDLDIDAAKSEDTTKLSRENIDNIAEKIEQNIHGSVLLNATETVTDKDSYQNTETNGDKNISETFTSIKHAEDNTERTKSITSNDALVLSTDTEVVLGSDAEKFKETNNSSGESKDNTVAQHTGETSYEKDTPGSVLNATETVTDKDSYQNTETNGNKNISETFTSIKQAEDNTEITTSITPNDAVVLSTDTEVVLGSDAEKCKETNNPSRESKDNIVAQHTGETSYEQDTPGSVLNATETVTDKDSYQNTETNGDKNISETFTSIKQADSLSTGGDDASQNKATCDDTTPVDSDNAKFACVPDLLQVSVDDGAASNDRRSSPSSPIPV